MAFYFIRERGSEFSRAAETMANKLFAALDAA
jgi:hypothetical protein